MEFLMREHAPLSDEQWGQIDRAVTETARRLLVGRRVLPVFGPVGAGQQIVFRDTLAGRSAASVDRWGEGGGEALHVGDRHLVNVPLLYRDFRLHWRDVETSRQSQIPLDTSAAAEAAAAVAMLEDDLIFNGSAAWQQVGLCTASGRQTAPLRDWNVYGTAHRDVANAVGMLQSAGFPGPYALVLSPGLFAAATRPVVGHELEIEALRELAADGVFPSVALRDSRAVLLASVPHALDLVIAQDLVTAFLDPDQMNLIFRVVEALALRVKRPEAVCVLEGRGAGAGGRQGGGARQGRGRRRAPGR
ncbi:MAG: bacteriocin family protein [Armatimonadetes bacterium]|nr:bacteriocin family protein [Armatimonadota bacterium]